MVTENRPMPFSGDSFLSSFFSVWLTWPPGNENDLMGGGKPARWKKKFFNYLKPPPVRNITLLQVMQQDFRLCFNSGII